MKPHLADGSALFLSDVAVTCFKRSLCDHIFVTGVAATVVIDEVFLLHRRSIAALYFDFNLVVC